MKKFYVGVKGVIKAEKGYLLLKHTKGHFDMPGGRMDGNEDFKDTLTRELSEELPGINDVKIGELVGSYRLQKDIEDDTSLVLLFFLVSANLTSPIVLSDEHQSYQWITSAEDIPAELNPQIDTILRTLV
jgi:8-oxo-dGTP pyrophosphatase MutT (NUDIX family)